MAERPLKIVFLDYVLEIDKPGRNGLSDVVWDMAGELVELGHDVQVVGPYPQSLAPDGRVTVHTYKVPPTGYRWFGGHLWMCQRMARIAHRLQPDIVHAPEAISIAVYNTLYPNQKSQQVVTVPGNIFHRLKATGQRTSASASLRVVTVPGNIFHKLRSKQGNPYAFFFTQCIKWASRKAATSGTSIIAISQEMKRAWQETGSPPEKTPMIPYGTNPRRFHPVSGARSRLGIDPATILLLYVGRFSREKAVLELVETVAACQTELRDAGVRVQMLGKGPQAEQVARKIADLELADLIVQTEWVDKTELPVWYSAADALLLPSYAEGFARVIPEAMACGTPVIGSRITGTEDHVLPGQNGFLFEPGQFDELADLLRQVALDPSRLRQMRPFTHEYARQHLTWPVIVGKVVREVYTPALSSVSSDGAALVQPL